MAGNSSKYAKNKLTRRARRYFLDGLSFKELAEEEGVREQGIKKQFELAGFVETKAAVMARRFAVAGSLLRRTYLKQGEVAKCIGMNETQLSREKSKRKLDKDLLELEGSDSGTMVMTALSSLDVDGSWRSDDGEDHSATM